MINLMEMKKQREQQRLASQSRMVATSTGQTPEMAESFAPAETPGYSSRAAPTTSATTVFSAAQLRLQKDVTELRLPPTLSVRFPDPQNLFEFQVVLCPDEGFYQGGTFLFDFHVRSGYPHEPPKLRCNQRIYHPNIDVDGNVCLNILREDWKPVLDLNAVLYGLQFLFLEPNPEDPLNKDAAEMLRRSPDEFQTVVNRSMRGDTYQGVVYDRVLR